MKMKSANSSVDWTIGLLQDLKVTIGGYDFYLQVQVVENAAYEILLGLPFHVLTQLQTSFFADGTSHIRMKDPNSGAVIKMATRERKSAAKTEEKEEQIAYQGF